MKVEREKEPFKPVKIVLESQEEVNKLYAILNHGPTIDPLEINSWYEELKPYQNASHEKHFDKLVKSFQKKV